MYHLRLFGITQLVDPTGEAVSFKRKHLAVLVVLALEARFRPVSRARLIDLLWPDVPVEKGSHSLSQACTMIKNVLGKEAISRFDQDIQLITDLTTDLDSLAPLAFDAADLASPLAGLEGCAGASWDHWLDLHRERCLADVRARLLADLPEARGRGDLEAVYRVAVLLYAVDPLNHVAALAIAEQLLIGADTAAAVRHLRKHNARTREELETEPPKQLELLLRRLEHGEMLVARGDPAPWELPDPVSSRPEVFVGREPEVARLEALWARAREGDMTTALITGVGGIGKSTLIRRVAASLTSRTWPAHLVACQEIGKSIPFSVVSDLIHQLAGDPAASGTDAHWLSEASLVAPGLTTVYSGIPEPSPAPAEAVRIRTAEAIVQILAVMSDGGPMLLAFDDVQYMDSASLEIMHRVMRRLAEWPVLILATMRSDERGQRLVRTGAAGLVEWLDEFVLPRLDAEKTRDLVRSLCRNQEDLDGRICSKIARLSQGNPHLTEMLLSDWEHNGTGSLVGLEMGASADTEEWHPPRTLMQAFQKQYQDLHDRSEQLLNLLAVAERSVSVKELESLLGVDTATVDRSVLELIDRALLRITHGTVGYRNALHRAFAYRTMSVDARVYHHARLGNYLAETRASQDFQRALEASHHFVRAGMTAEAVEAVCIGADIAVTKGAPKEAEKALGRVMMISPTKARKQLCILLSRALSAQQHYRESLDILPRVHSATSPTDAAIVLSLRAQALHRARLADTGTVHMAATAAVGQARKTNDQVLTLTSQQILAEIAYEEERWAEIEQIESDCARTAKAPESEEIRALALYTLGYCLFANGDAETASENLAESCKAFEALGHHPHLYRALNGLGMCHTKLGETERAVDALRHSIVIAEESSDFAASANARGNLGVVYNEVGQFAAAKDVFTASMEPLEHSSNSRVPTAIFCNAAILAIMLGSFAEAEELLERASESAARSRIWQHSVSVMLTRADLCLASHQPELAWQLVDQADSRVRGRAESVPDIGQYWRLRQQFREAAGHRPTSLDNNSYPLDMRSTVGLAHQLEIRAFEDWLRAQRDDHADTSVSVVEEIVRNRFWGVLARLASVHIRLAPIPEPAGEESAASLVARTFDECDVGIVPSRVFESNSQA